MEKQIEDYIKNLYDWKDQVINLIDKMIEDSKRTRETLKELAKDYE